MMSMNEIDPGRTQWALRIDCDLNGCETRHADHGDVIVLSGRLAEYDKEHRTINGHKCALLSRTMPDWTEES